MLGDGLAGRVYDTLSSDSKFLEKLHLLTSKSKAAGLSDSSEPSSRSGVRHFWQYMMM